MKLKVFLIASIAISSTPALSNELTPYHSHLESKGFNAEERLLISHWNALREQGEIETHCNQWEEGSVSDYQLVIQRGLSSVVEQYLGREKAIDLVSATLDAKYFEENSLEEKKQLIDSYRNTDKANFDAYCGLEMINTLREGAVQGVTYQISILSN